MQEYIEAGTKAFCNWMVILVRQSNNTFPLKVLKGKPDEVFPKVWKEWGVTKLLYEKDFEPYAIERDTKIDDLAKKEGRFQSLLTIFKDGANISFGYTRKICPIEYII